ncbi:MAG: UDP-N-acetylglucosamine 2-epimerase (non-hydrolyzing) [Coriobacteriia bacterium]|nr:UDP-N-acetylglucosamine 2-epimerase (non-hydrolyzing) [Coriobacteriia bacterium]
MKIISIVGARPNFMKIAPFCHAISASPTSIEHLLVHTGQHYDDKMSEAFFTSLSIPAADINLGVGSGTHAEQVGRTMIAIERVLIEEQPDWVVVVGDVNATAACSITAKKLGIRVAHIEAGLRSRDMSMPEEINRLVTDRISDLLLTPDRLSSENLIREGVDPESIVFTGNIMIDTLESQRDKAAKLDLNEIIDQNKLAEENSTTALEDGGYAVITLHRPSNVDSPETLMPLVRFFLDEVATDMPLVWPVHPRTKKNLQTFGLWDELVAHDNMLLVEPLGYHDLLRLNMGAKLMFTDSGGLQEECCVLGTPCLTLRWNTERPITLRENGGASVLVGNDISKIRAEYHHTLSAQRTPLRPELWDGHAAERMVEALIEANTR